MQRAKAFFDVDGTVIRTDSFRLLIYEALKKQPWRIFLLAVFLPVFLATPIFQIDKALAKSCTLWSLTVGLGKRKAVALLRDALSSHWDRLWFEQMDGVLQNLRLENISIVYVSASGQTWLRSLLRRKDPGAKFIIGSKLGFAFGGVVFRSRNCYGTEKVHRIQAQLGTDITWHAGYSDHTADIPMLALCKHRYLIGQKGVHLASYRKAFGADFMVYDWQNRS